MTTTPDELAATPAAPTWRGNGVPEGGRHIRVDYRVGDNGRTTWTTAYGIVGGCEVEDDNLAVILLDTAGNASRRVVLNASYGLDKWTYTGDVHAEHEYRKATDPVYLHHSDTLDEKMGLARLRAEEHARDFDNAVPAAVVESVERYGMSPDELNPTQRAAYERHRTRPPEPSTYSDPAVLAAVAKVTGSGLLSDVESPAPDDAAVSDPDAGDIPGMLRRLQWLKARIGSIEADLKSTKAEYAGLNAEAVREMASEGMTSSTINGYTAFFAPKQHVEKAGPEVTPEDVLEAMRKAGLGHMIKPGYSGQTLKAYLAELDRDGVPVPEALADVVVLKTDYEIRFTRAAAKKRAVPKFDVSPIGGGVSDEEPITLGSADH